MAELLGLSGVGGTLLPPVSEVSGVGIGALVGVGMPVLVGVGVGFCRGRGVYGHCTDLRMGTGG